MRVHVHLYYCHRMYDILAEKSSSLRELLQKLEIPEDIVLFTAPPSDTPLVNLDKTLVDYNMWFPEKSYIAEITVYNKTDNYNKELYEMYLEAAEKTV